MRKTKRPAKREIGEGWETGGRVEKERKSKQEEEILDVIRREGREEARL